jgi:predicted DsbA family dithiol-disulfide isomerase
MSNTQQTPAHINFHTDPLCPFAWRTALWAREARKVRPLEITWRLFSLEVANRPQDGTADYVNGRGWTALRTLALARRLYGNETIEKLYLELGNAQHGRRENISERAVVEDCVKRVGLEDIFVATALADDTTITEVLNDHEEATKRYHAFGVPVIAYEGSEIGIFGPVIIDVPTGDEAGEMWDHVSWAMKTPNFYELKRERVGTSLNPLFAN